MLKKNIILLSVLIIFLLAGCKQEPCETDYIKDYSELQNQFGDLFVSPEEGKALSFKSAVGSFLQKYDGVKCLSGDEKLDPSDELKAILTEFKTVKPSKSLPSSRYKIVYGNDDRVDVVDSGVSTYRDWSRSTMAQISADRIGANGDLIGISLGSKYQLCDGERFSEQLTVAACSGFLVGPDILVTAGHCMDGSISCSNYTWVLDYTKGVTNIPTENRYNCKEVIDQIVDDSLGLDYAVVRLDRNVKGRKFFRWRTEGVVNTADPLVVIGNPSGLPIKIADGAEVKGNSNKNYFEANLDTFSGNSGSVVINATSGLAEGILVRGERDYVIADDQPCLKVNTCSDESGCLGEFEEATRMSSVENIPGSYGIDEIYSGIYIKSNIGEVSTDVPLVLQGYSYGEYLVAGKKFLNRCGAMVQNIDGSTANSFVTSCDNESQLLGAIQDFYNSLYF